MIQISAQMRVLVAIEPVDGRKGIDSLVRLCQEKAEDPFSGGVFVFRSRSGIATAKVHRGIARIIRRSRRLVSALKALLTHPGLQQRAVHGEMLQVVIHLFHQQSFAAEYSICSNWVRNSFSGAIDGRPTRAYIVSNRRES
jgi:hypothetical protein